MLIKLCAYICCDYEAAREDRGGRRESALDLQLLPLALKLHNTHTHTHPWSAQCTHYCITVEHSSRNTYDHLYPGEAPSLLAGQHEDVPVGRQDDVLLQHHHGVLVPAALREDRRDLVKQLLDLGGN